MYLKEVTTQLILQLAVPTQQSSPLSRFYKGIINAEQEAKINQFNTAQNPNRRARTATKELGERDERIFRIVSRYDGLTQMTL